MSRRSVVYAWAGGVVILLIAITVFRIDLSAMHDFEQDVVVRTTFPDRASIDRYADSSPYSVWLPSDLFVWDSIRAGHLPTWNRLQGGGYSPLIGFQEGVLHPLRWVVAMFPRAVAPSALILLALAAGFLGMALLGVDLGYSPGAACAAAAIFALSSGTMSFAQFSGCLLPLMHIPWLAWSARRERLGAVCVAAALLFVSGHPLFIACALFAAMGVATANTSRRPAISLIAGTVLGAFLAGPAIAPPLVGWGALWNYKTRTGASHSYVIYSLGGWLKAVRAVVSDVYPWGTCCLDLDAYFLYVGVPALILAIAGVAAAFRSRRGIALALFLCIALLVVVPGPWMAPLIRIFSPFKTWYLLGFFICFLAIVAGAGFDAFSSRGTIGRAAAVVLTLAAAAIYVWRAQEILQPHRAVPIRESPAIAFLKSDHSIFRVMSMRGQTHLANASRITGVEDLRIAAPMMSLRYHWWWQVIDPNVLLRSFPTTRVTPLLRSPLVADFNVKYVLQSRLEPATTFRTNFDRATLDRFLSPALNPFPVVYRTPLIEIRRVDSARPRAHFAERVFGVTSFPDAVEQLRKNQWLPGVAEVVENESRIALPERAIGSVAVRYPADSRVVLDVRSATGGLVVLHDTYAPGWEATVDGETAPIYPVNLLSRGVVVKPGVHRIEMSYAPPGIVGGAAFSIAALLVLVLLSRRKAVTP